MMVYFDTNILLYAFIKDTDDKKQRDISVKLVEEAIDNNTLIISEVILCEFAFVSSKLNESKDDIDDNLEFLLTFLQPSNFSINQRMIEILKETSLYVSSSDVSHLAFAEYHNAKLVTFDKGFKKLKNISNIEIDIK